MLTTASPAANSKATFYNGTTTEASITSGKNERFEVLVTNVHSELRYVIMWVVERQTNPMSQVALDGFHAQPWGYSTSFVPCR